MGPLKSFIEFVVCFYAITWLKSNIVKYSLNSLNLQRTIFKNYLSPLSDEVVLIKVEPIMPFGDYFQLQTNVHFCFE